MPFAIKTCSELTNFPYHNIRVHFIETVNFIKAVRINVLQNTLKQVYRLPSDRTEIDNINLLTPNVNYSGRTAPLTSKVAYYIFIQQI